MSANDQNSPYSLQFWLGEFEEQNNWPAVLHTAKKMLNVWPDHPEALRYAAEAYFRLGNFPAAHDAALRLVNLCPLCPDGFWILADIYAETDELERSAEFLEQTARRLHNNDEIWIQVSKTYYHLNRWAKSLAAADRGLKINPCSVPLFVLKVFCLCHLGRNVAARIAASRLLDLGIDADDLREASRKLGITGATLASVYKTAHGQNLLNSSNYPRTCRQGIKEASNKVPKTIKKLSAMTSEQFRSAWAKAQVRFERVFEKEPYATKFEPDLEDMLANEVFYVYDRYRIWGPYSENRLVQFFHNHEFNLCAAWIREETSLHWVPAKDFLESLKK